MKFGDKEHTRWLRENSTQPDGADLYLRCMFEEAEESNKSVNWDALDHLFDAVGYSECRERTLR